MGGGGRGGKKEGGVGKEREGEWGEKEREGWGVCVLTSGEWCV